MSDEKDPDNSQKKVFVGIGILFIVGGAYGLSTGDIGWSLIIIGCSVLAYIAITGKV